MGKKYFGTDGIRGKVGEAPITADFMLKLGWAVGRVMSAQGKDLVLIGKDTRISGYMFESSLEAGLSTAGVNSRLIGPMPTPAIAYLTRTFRACAGIVISASHNPYYDNGIKFFSPEGFKLPDETEYAIEAELEKEMVTVESARLGKVKRVRDAAGRYIEFCKHTIGSGVSLKGLRIVVDGANGATYQVAPAVFEELGAFVHKINVEPNGLNINLDCGSTKPAGLQKAVVELGADLGIAFDGDGDRVIMVDRHGNIVDGDELLYVMALGRLDAKEEIGPVVGTLMTNLGLELAFKEKGLEFIRANVGDRYVLEQLHKHGGILGGESSGHLICLDKQTTGDGIVSALQVLSAIVQTGKSIDQLCEGLQKCPMHMINVKVTDKAKAQNADEVKVAIAKVEEKLGDKGRVLIRPSGTEPVVRVMVEGIDADEVRALTQELAEVVERAS